ncbi:TPA: Zn-ribbon domain-containing OB-fold protein [Candidatus Bathyarchaeota archaeon]|nr:Zn-ribbon domain-containing OB-fold protein [Candidatus Bathyarchaeota archaeon]
MSTQPFTIEQFYKFMQQKKLMAGKCTKCGKTHLPPRPLCDNCFSKEFEWVEVNGKGTLLTYTVIHIAPTQFQSLAPYAVGIVQLEKDLRIPGMITRLGLDKLAIGLSLTIDFDTCNAAQIWPQWPRYCFKPS